MFLLDVDNTLIDNDRVKGDIRAGIAKAVPPDRAARFWSIYEEVRSEEGGVVNFPETLRRFRRAFPEEPGNPAVDDVVLTVPFERYLYPESLRVVDRLWTLGEVAILSDGDRVYQPAKIAGAGLLRAVRGNVLVYEHKEDHLPEVTRRFPASGYVHVDDKAELLARTKLALGSRCVTVHVHQGHYSDEPSGGPAPDIELEGIGDLLAISARDLGA